MARFPLDEEVFFLPTYEYECQSCHRHFEVRQGMKDDPLTTCDECGGEVQRLVSAGSGFIFKGSGFYITDYRSDQYKKRAKEDASPSETKSSETKSSESKSTSEKKKDS